MGLVGSDNLVWLMASFGIQCTFDTKLKILYKLWPPLNYSVVIIQYLT